MKWQNDKYKDLKYQILDILSQGLAYEDAVKISFYKVGKAIDQLFLDLQMTDDSTHTEDM